MRSQYPSAPVRVTEEPLVVHWEDGIQMLRDAGHEVRFACQPVLDLGLGLDLDLDLDLDVDLDFGF